MDSSTTSFRVPFNRPTVAPQQLDYVSSAFGSGHLAGDGSYTASASQLLSGIHNESPVLLTTSGTSALEMAALLLEVGPGDEVIVPSFTFSSTAAAFALRGAKVVFADVDATTWSLDANEVEQLLTPKTKVVVPVHYGGVEASLESLIPLCQSRDVAVVEDNCHGLFGLDATGQPLGTRSSLSVLSFHATKNISCGEGGAIVINDSSLLDRAEVLREKGTDRRKFLEGKVDKYSWIELGSSFLPSEISAAVLAAQLEFAKTIQQRRSCAADRYRSALAEWAEASGVALFPFYNGSELRQVPDHLFALGFPSNGIRKRFLEHSASNGVQSTFHYVPLHDAPAGRHYGSAPRGCQVTDRVSSRLARLPLFSDIRTEEVEFVVEMVLSFEI